MHEQRLEAKAVGKQAEPEQMAVHTRELVEDDAQVRGTVRDLDSHELLDAFGVAQGVAKRADAANTLRHVHELRVITFLDELLESTVHIADTRNCVDDGLVLEDKVEVDRLGQDGVLRSERDGGALTHGLPPAPRRHVGSSGTSARPCRTRLGSRG